MAHHTYEKNERHALSKFIAQECTKLGIRFVCPFKTIAEDGSECMFAAHLPQFWSNKGVLIDIYLPKSRTVISRRTKIAEDLGIPATFVNPEPLYADPSEFVGCLIDWGYRGDSKDLKDETRVMLLGI